MGLAVALLAGALALVSGPAPVGALAGAPTADAGVAQTVHSHVTVTLVGTGSVSGTGDPLTYEWTQTSGPTVSLSDATAATPTFLAPIGPATLGFSLTVDDGGSTSAAATTSVTVTPPADYLTDEQFIVDEFLDLFHRPPTAAEDSEELALLAAGMTRAELVESLLALDRPSLLAHFAAVAKNGQPGPQTSNITYEYIYMLNTIATLLTYEAALNRYPDPTGFDYYYGVVGVGQDDALRVGTSTVALGGPGALEMAKRLTASAEFKRKAGKLNDAAFVAHLYDTMLHRSPDAKGGQYWRAKLARGTSRAVLVAAFATSSEAIRRAGKEVEVIASHKLILGHIPSPTKTAALAQRLEDGEPFAVEITEILDSPEYAELHH